MTNQQPRASGYAWVILAATILVGLVVGGLGRFGNTLILPSIRDDLQLSYTQSGLLATTSFVGYLVAALVGGLVNARLGVRGASVLGLIAMLLGMIGSAFAPGYPILLVLQLPIGFGTGTAMIAAISTLPAWFPVHQRGLISGLGNGAAGLGILLSGAVVPPLLTGFGPTGWRQVWLAFAVAVGLGLIAAALFLRRRAVSPGSVRPTGRPRRPGAIYRAPLYWRLALVALVMGATTSVYGTYFGAYGTRQLGLDESLVGRIWSLVGMLSLLSGILWGMVSDRLGRQAALAGVMGVQAFANFILVVSPGSTTLTLSAAIAGLTLFGGAAIMTALMSDLIEPELLPAVGGLLAIGFGVGQIAGPAAAGVLADLADSLRAAYVFSGVVTVLGVVSVLTLPALRRHPASQAGAPTPPAAEPLPADPEQLAVAEPAPAVPAPAVQTPPNPTSPTRSEAMTATPAGPSDPMR